MQNSLNNPSKPVGYGQTRQNRQNSGYDMIYGISEVLVVLGHENTSHF